MRTAARLKIDVRNMQKPDSARTARWLYGKRAHQIGIGVELGFVDPARRHLMVLADQAVDLGFYFVLIEHDVAGVEIQTRTLRPDLPAGHARRDDGAEQMQTRVHPHMAVAAVPIDLGGEFAADRRRFRTGGPGDAESPLRLCACRSRQGACRRQKSACPYRPVGRRPSDRKPSGRARRLPAPKRPRARGRI